ncbi:sulfotransferase domain-containing protein [Candidatus Pelagibacter sp.]|nr:sulfotransferase domain-containing protein [Candidatus Pelagibacter sp.]
MKSNNKKFVFGLGNQKCGTSWLYSYLQQFDNFHEGFWKECRIWDAIDIPESRRFKINLFDLKLLRIGSVHYKRYRMQNSDSYYFDYFNSLFNDKINIVSDITPSYSGLDIDRLEEIKLKFESKNIEVKPIILIRDPLSRIKSAVRSNLDKKNYYEGIKPGETNFLKALKQYYKSNHCKQYTNYHKIITKAFKVFGENKVYVGIYENMFLNKNIDKLSNYLGVKSNHEYSNIQVNKTMGSVFETEIDDTIKDFYKEVYKFCNKIFPSTNDLWK